VRWQGAATPAILKITSAATTSSTAATRSTRAAR